MLIQVKSARNVRNWLLGAAWIRATAALLAFPLAPFLYERHFLVLVLMRPTNLVIFLGGALAKQNQLQWWQIAAAAIPLQILIVWLYYLLGKAWADEIQSDSELPLYSSRLVPADRIKRLKRVLRKKGQLFVFLSRFALFPTGLLGAAAGSSDLDARRFFAADTAAAVASSGAALTAGYLLGQAAFGGRGWVIAAGVVGLLGLSGLLTVYLDREPGKRR
jgi:membrane protein DedA with SNARE-associated domain